LSITSSVVNVITRNKNKEKETEKELIGHKANEESYMIYIIFTGRIN